MRRVVLLSALAVDDEATPPRSEIATHHRALEEALPQYELNWVILRPGMFAANTITQWAAQIRAGVSFGADQVLADRGITVIPDILANAGG